MKFSVIVNTRSGSVPDNGDVLISEELTGLGHEFDIYSVEGADLEDVWKQQDLIGCDGIIVWGGDGTISFVLSHACRADIPVLPLPGGTMNLLPKHIHGNDCEWRDCLSSALENGQTKPLAGMQIGDQMCYVGVLIGRLTRLAHSREHLRTGAVGSAVETLVGNDVLNLKTRLEVHGEDENWDATALGIFVPEDDTPGLDIASIDPDNLAQLVEMSVESLIGNWKTANGVEHRTVREIDIATKDEKPVSVTLDGEPRELKSPFSIAFCPEAATVWSARS